MLAFFNNVKNFVAKDPSRPLFQGICFDGKRIVATNTHVLVGVTNFISEPKIVHYKTGEEIKGTYPDFDKVIPESTENNIAAYQISDWIRTLKIAQSIDKDEYLSVSLVVKDGKVKIQRKCLTDEYVSEMPVHSIDGEMPVIHFNAKFLHDILVFFRDANVTNFTIGYNEWNKPMKITADKNVFAVLCPVRAS